MIVLVLTLLVNDLGKKRYLYIQYQFTILNFLEKFKYFYIFFSTVLSITLVKGTRGKGILIPEANWLEVTVVAGIDVITVRSLHQVVQYRRNG